MYNYEEKQSTKGIKFSKPTRLDFVEVRSVIYELPRTPQQSLIANACKEAAVRADKKWLLLKL